MNPAGPTPSCMARRTEAAPRRREAAGGGPPNTETDMSDDLTFRPPYRVIHGLLAQSLRARA